MASLDIEIDVDEFYYECSKKEKQNLISNLEEDGLLDDYVGENVNISPRMTNLAESYDQSLLFDSLIAINASYYQMTTEEIDTILKIAAKYR